jgi:1-acyl-sn-glycerol-3-phosphate acyltransferase
MPVVACLHRELRRGARAARLAGHLLLGALLAHLVLGRLVRAQRHDTLVRWWVRGILRILHVRLEIEGEASTEPALFAANHVSWLDIVCLRAALDTEFVAKQEVSRWPVIGRMAGLAGTLFLNRGERDASLVAANGMSRALAAGRSVAIFPEGTTGDGRRLRRFHARLYQAAIRARRPVQAVAIAYPHPDDGRGCTRVAEDRASRAAGVHPAAPFVGDDNLGRHVWTLLAEDGLTARLTLCPPVPATGERRALAEHTRAQIADALGLWRPLAEGPALDRRGTAAGG